MDVILQGLDFVYVYLDDTLVASRSRSEHIEHARQVLQRLHGAGLVVNLSKCQFGRAELDFLGHRISKEGIVPLPSKVEAIVKFVQPTTIKGLQEFVEMVNFYHRFIPGIAGVMQPLFQALSRKPKTLAWAPDMISAFFTAKQTLAKATLLVFPSVSSPTTLTVDASDTAVGAALEQLHNGVWKAAIVLQPSAEAR